MRASNATRRRTLDRVLLAVYWLADSEGLTCEATDDQIGRAARCSPRTARSCLLELEANGHIDISLAFQRIHKYRYIILLDHPLSAATSRLFRTPAKQEPKRRAKAKGRSKRG
jgi:hypothetical protein